MATSRKRAYGSGSVFVRGDAYYGKWRVAGQQVKRKLGPIKGPDTPHGLTRKRAEAKLRELMSSIEPPRYITSTLGPRPEGRAPRTAWDQALHTIERYRARHGVNDRGRALGPRPERAELAAWLEAHA